MLAPMLHAVDKMTTRGVVTDNLGKKITERERESFPFVISFFFLIFLLVLRAF